MKKRESKYFSTHSLISVSSLNLLQVNARTISPQNIVWSLGIFSLHLHTVCPPKKTLHVYLFYKLPITSHCVTLYGMSRDRLNFISVCIDEIDEFSLNCFLIWLQSTMMINSIDFKFVIMSFRIKKIAAIS